MNKTTILLILVTVLFSCKKASNSGFDAADKQTDLVKNTEKDKNSNSNIDKSIYTKYVYTNSKGKSLIVQNSLPKGGIKYTDPKGNEYIYAIFWTRMINETDNSIELKINFPVNSYEIPSLPGKYYKTLIPSDAMTIQKIPLFNYGLTNLEPFFDKNIDKPSSLKRTIKQKNQLDFML